LRGLLLRERRGGKRGGVTGEGRGEWRRGEGREEKGEEAFLVMWPRRLSALNPPLLPALPDSDENAIITLYDNTKCA